MYKIEAQASIHKKDEERKYMQHLLDYSIKNVARGRLDTRKCYEINGKTYDRYIDNETWGLFVNEMKDLYYSAYCQYKKGGGHELEPKGITPPHMACYGSSSRMIYLLARDISTFVFEKELPTTIGKSAYMDGYLHKNKTRYYVEAKCREPYTDNKGGFIMSQVYGPLYEYLDTLPWLNFNCTISEVEERTIQTKFFANGKEILHFDIKQMICHLLGIATENIENPTGEKIKFLYLLFNPMKIELLDSPKKDSLLKMYQEEIAECDSIPFAGLYKGVVQYLLETKKVVKNDILKVDDVVGDFSFARCDQTNFIEELK